MASNHRHQTTGGIRMKNQKRFILGMFTILLFASLQVAVLGQTASQSAEAKVANVRAEGMAVRFDSAIPYSNAILTVSGPDGTVYRREFAGGTVPSLSLFDKTGAAMGNGQYTYELRFTTLQMRDLKQRLATAPDEGVMDENGRTSRGRLSVQSVVQSGSFSVQNGALYVGNETEPSTRPAVSPKGVDKNPQPRAPGVPSGNTLNRLRNHRLSLFSMPDQVIPDDLIVQGSACVGLDCVNNESFGFDTIRLKENNTRIKFQDTSTSAGFPTHDWQLTANDSASGGAEKFSIEDVTAATVPFTITGSSPSNSIFVDSTGRVGFRTATPVLDLHIATSNTPAHRLEQTSAGGFTAQTWDVAGNEANFFVRDVTGGSRLPFRIRPGAPTSSIDINASGNVGIGTASPSQKLHVVASSIADGVRITGTTAGTISPAFTLFDSSSQRGALGLAEAAGHFSSDAAVGDIVFQASSGKLLLQSGSGASAVSIGTNNRVGIGTTIPDQKLSVNGDASKTGGNTWLAFSDERLKNIKGRFNTGLKAVMQLQPIRYEYKPDNALGLVSEGDHIGFGASAVQKIIPEAVTRSQNGYLMLNSDPILWTMLNAIKEQQKEIVELKGQIQKLRSASHQRGNRSRR
jgi:Chaperone of endosialidase